MKTIVILCPYFGRVDLKMFDFWLQGCAFNPSIHFMFITDDTDALEKPMPKNVSGIFMSWNDCVSLVKSKFDFEITLNDPYKICDFRPAFGIIFSKYTEGYDFWGHMDSSDIVMGDLRKFLTDGILTAYDKVHAFGHLTLYRNTYENNHRFLTAPSCGLTCRNIFNLPELKGFDDVFHPWSINTIYKENGFSLLARVNNLVADIYQSKWAFQIWEDRGEKVPRVFEWDHGKLFDVTAKEGKLRRREIGYVHFQKRKMLIEIQNVEDHFYMIPNRFIPAAKPLTCEQIEEWSRDRLYLYPLKQRVKRIINYAKKPDVFFRKIREKLG